VKAHLQVFGDLKLFELIAITRLSREVSCGSRSWSSREQDSATDPNSGPLLLLIAAAFWPAWDRLRPQR
jgi:hypothetical protein